MIPDKLMHGLGLVARVDITTEDNRYYLQGLILWDKLLEGMEFSFILSSMFLSGLLLHSF